MSGIAIAANGQEMRIIGTTPIQIANMPMQSAKVLAGDEPDKVILSVGKLADHSVISVFESNKWTLYEKDTFGVHSGAKTIATGVRDESTGGLYIMNNFQLANADKLQIIDEKQPTPETLAVLASINTFYGTMKLKSTADKVRFFHAVFAHPTFNAFHSALAKHLGAIIPVTAKEASENPPKTVATVRGHLHNLAQGIASTKPKAQAGLESNDEDRKSIPGFREEVNATFPVNNTDWHVHLSGRIAMDATGKMHVQSYTGHTAIFILYHPATNYIRAVPFRSKAEISRLMCALYAEQIQLGHTITNLYIDNEIDNAARAYLTGYGVKINNVAPYCHRANPAERAIGTYKDHFIALLSGRDPSCPLSYWSEAITHAEVTLNLLRAGPGNTSAYEAYWNRKYDIAQHPLLPWGMRCEAYVPDALRTTFEERSTPCFYVGASYANYRAHRLISTDTNKKTSIFVRQQLVGFPHDVPFPKWSEAHDIKQRVTDLANTFKKLNGESVQATNTAEALKAYADAIILPERTLPIEAFTSGTGRIRWLGRQRVDTETGQVIEELEEEENDLNIPISTVQQIPPDNVTSATIAAKAPTNAPERTLPEPNSSARDAEQKIDEEPAAPDQGLPIMHSDTIVSEGVIANAQGVPNVSEGVTDFNDAPSHVPSGAYRTRAQAKEDARQQILNELANRQSKDDKLDIMMEFAMTMQPEESEEKWHVVQGKRRKIYSRYSKTYKNSRKHRGKHKYRLSVLKEDDHKQMNMRKAMTTPDAELWKKAHAEELERYLAMPGLRMLMPGERPYGCRARPVILVLEHKADKDRRVRAAFNGSPMRGDNREEQYTQFSSDIDTKKIFWAALATNGKLGVRHCTMDIAAFYLHDRNHLPRVEHLLYPASYLPDFYKAKYASYIGDDNMILFECSQAVYGMYDAGSIAGRVLAETLIAADYYEVGHQSCMWRSKRPGEELVYFNINVDDIDFMGLPNAGHKERLLQVLESVGYKVSHTSFDDDVQHFCGYQIVHDSKANTVMVSMPGYVDSILKAFGMENVPVQKHPYRYSPPAFSAKQPPVPEDDSTELNLAQIKELQQKLGKLHWYCGICYEIVTKVSKIASEQSRPTFKQLNDINHIIAYLAGRKNTALFFKPSNMQLYTESDASFASESKSKSRIGGVFLLGGYGTDGLPINSPIGVFSKIADCHPDSAAEAEYVACHDVVKKGVPLRFTLDEFGFPQTGATENRSDNACAVGMTNDLVMDRKTKHIDRRYHWTRYEVKKGTFKVIWYKGSTNLADFFTKLMSPADHERFTNAFTVQYTIREGVTAHKGGQ
jgi:hypothetical protein